MYEEQELPTLPEHLSSLPVFSRVRVTRSLVLCICFVDRCLSFFNFFLWRLCCLFFDIWIPITPLVSSNSSLLTGDEIYFSIANQLLNNTLLRSKGPSWSLSYGNWIYNDLCNQCLSPLKLWVRTPFMARCTRYNIMWKNLSVTCGRSAVFSVHSGFHHQLKWPPRYNWNIVESGVRHHKPKPNQRTSTHFSFYDFTSCDSNNTFVRKGVFLSVILKLKVLSTLSNMNNVKE